MKKGLPKDNEKNDIKVGILTTVFIAMDYFFGCQKSIFNLENNKGICQGSFFAYHVTEFTYSTYLHFSSCISQGYIQKDIRYSLYR